MRLPALAACLLLAGCSEVCGDGSFNCITRGAVLIRVVDADTNAALTDAVVLWSKGASEAEVAKCPENAGEVDSGNCRALGEPGSYHLIVRAAGYAETALDVATSADLCGHWSSQIREVGLQKLGTAAQPLVDASEGCGG